MKTLLAGICLLALFALTNCKKDHADVIKETNSNLITNSGFESNGDSTFQGWTGKDYALVNDVPANDGLWALQLVPGWIPEEGFAETSVTGFNGNYSFILNCETKVINWTGQIVLRKIEQGGFSTDLATTSFNNSTWTSLSLTTNVSLQPTDKLVVHLSAGVTEVVTGQVLFDNISLEIQ